MASEYDGVVDIGLDLETQPADMALNKFRQKLRSSFTGNDVKGLENQIRATAKTIETLEKKIEITKNKLQDIATSKTAPASVVAMEKELEKASNDADRLGQQLDRLQSQRAGIMAKGTEGWTSRTPVEYEGKFFTEAQAAQLDNLDFKIQQVTKDFEIADDKVVLLNYQLRELQANPQLTEEAKQYTQELEKSEQALQQQVQQYNQLDAQIQQAKSQQIQVTNEVSRQQQAYKEVNKEQDTFNNNAGKAIPGLAGITKTLHRIQGLIKRVFFFSIITKALRSLRQGLGNIISKNSELSNSLAQIKGNLLTAFAPIWSAILPALQALMSALATVTGYIAQFVALLTGKSIKASQAAAKALKEQAGAAKSAGGAAKSAGEEVEKSLLSFDELNTIDTQKSTGGGGGGGGGGASGIETAFTATDSGLWQDFLNTLQKIRDIFMSGFWQGFSHADFSSVQRSIDSIMLSMRNIFSDPEVQNAASRLITQWSFDLGRITGSIGAIGVNIGVGLLRGIALSLSRNTEGIKRWLISMFDVETEVSILWGNLFEGLATISQAFASEQAQEFVAAIITSIATTFGNTTLLAAKLGRDTLQIPVTIIFNNADKIKETLQNILTPVTIVINAVTRLQTIGYEELQKVYDEHMKPFFDDISQDLSDIYGDILDIMNEDILPKITEWAKDFDEALNTFEPGIQNMTKLFGDFIDVVHKGWNEVLIPFIDWVNKKVAPLLSGPIVGLGAVIDGITAAIGGLFSEITEYGTLISDSLKNLFKGDWKKHGEDVKKHLINILKINGKSREEIKKSFIRAWNAGKETLKKAGIDTAFKTTMRTIKKIADTQLKKIQGFFDTAWTNIKTVWENVKTWFPERWSDITDAFSETETWFQDTFQNAWNNITEIWENVKTWFSERYQDIKDVFDGADKISEWFRTVFQGAWDKVTEIWGEVKTWFSERYQDIKNVFDGKSSEDGKGVKTWFKDTFQEAWDEIKKVFDDWDTFFGGLWTKVKNKFTDFGSKMGEAVGGALKQAINAALTTIQRIINDGIDNINGAIKIINTLLPGKGISTISHITLPRLAKGAVLPPNKPFLALLGDQKSGTNIEAPLSTIEQAVENVLSRKGYSETPQNININFTGNLAQLARILNPVIEREKRNKGTPLVKGSAY